MMPPVIDWSAFKAALGLASAERVELADFDPRSGDYRVFHLALNATAEGRHTLHLELHRQAPGFRRRIFPLFLLSLSAVNDRGLCNIELYHCDAILEATELARALPLLAGIGAALREGERPRDELLKPFMSRSAQVLWSKPLPLGNAA